MSIAKKLVMKNYEMSRALYALPGGVICPRRKPVAIPIIVALVGVVMLVVNAMIPAQASYVNLKSAMVMFGAVFVLVGVIISIIRFSGASNSPWHVADGCFLKREELKFVKERSAEIRNLVRKGDFTTLRSLPEDGVSAVTAVIYSSPRGSFCAVQVFEYIDLELQPVDEMKVVM